MTDMRSEYSKTLIELGRENPNIVVLGADTTDSLKTSGFGKIFPNRFFILFGSIPTHIFYNNTLKS